MLQEKLVDGSAICEDFENSSTRKSLLTDTGRVTMQSLLPDTFRGGSTIFQKWRLPVIAAVFIVAILCSHPATAGYYRYTCKDGYQTSSQTGCNGRGGIKSQTYISICGDGVLDVGEACDKGSNNSDSQPNGCRTDCRRAYCGDGVIDAGEQCDDGYSSSQGSANKCRKDCTLPFCGDGIVDDGSHPATGKVFNEACDDGNQDDSDGCTAKCEQCLPLGQMGNIEITANTDLCPAEYSLDDYGDYGAIIIKASGITLDCHGATLIGEGRGVGIVNFRSNDVVIKNCRIRGYDIGIRIQDARNVTLQGNSVCDNHQRDIELVEATDIHGYNPSMAAVTVCMDMQVQKPGKALQAAAMTPTQASGNQSSAAPSTVSKNSRTTGKRTIGTSQPKTAVASMSKKQPTKLAAISTAKESRQLLYQEAAQATWTSKSAKVVFGSDRVPNIGIARVLNRGQLADGKMASKLLLTQPDWKKGGFIQGEFPALKFAGNTHFKTTVALLKGADPADTLSFDVIIREGGRNTVVKKQPLRGTQRASINVNLSRWRGKTVQVVLRVRHLKGTKTVPAVWVNPVLENN
jgi:cysteine-rich repeat protein/parallel beta-helix repeat protein